MTLEDESYLSAYLDGELAPDQRRPIESALSSDPDLAERLRQLAALRGLIAGLPRPVLAVDLADAIGARIAGPTPRRGARRLLRSLRVPGRLPSTAVSLGGLGLAASVLIAVVFALQARRPALAPAPVVPPHHAEVAARTEPRPSASDRTIEPAESLSETVNATVTLDREQADLPRPSPAGAEVATTTDPAREAEKIRKMLDSPNLRRVFIVTDVLGGATLDRVEDLVQNTPRTDSTYGRITVTQGIVIDPRHPNEATVFALVMNEQELKHFQRKLEQSLPRAVEDVDADPRMVTQLADIGQVAVLSGSTASEVVIPGAVSPRIALRTDEGRLGTLHEKSRITSEFGSHGDTGIADLGLAAEAEAGARGGPGEPGSPFRKRPPIGPPPPILAHRDDSPPVATPEGATIDPARPPDLSGPLAEALAIAPALKEAPAIVLVWVTTR